MSAINVGASRVGGDAGDGGGPATGLSQAGSAGDNGTYGNVATAGKENAVLRRQISGSSQFVVLGRVVEGHRTRREIALQRWHEASCSRVIEQHIITGIEKVVADVVDPVGGDIAVPESRV